MTSIDVRDMLDLPNAAAGAGPRPAKKQKIAGPRPNLKGLQREVQSLGGDNPIAIVPEVSLFKKRRLASRKPAARWELKPFRNSARKDGLILKHWRRIAERPPVPAAVDGEDISEKKEEEVQKKEEGIDDSFFAKFDVQVNIPNYDDEQYESKLKNDDWSREETDYLMNLCREYDLRWPVIWDRYEYAPIEQMELALEGESQALVPERKIRTMEDLKARYYDVAAKMMALQRPVQFMSQAEFSLHQLMTSFNPQQERIRKHFADTAMSRSAEERREEESLLIELKRIMARSERLNEERKELYARLEAPPSTSNVGIYTTSQGLQQLVQQLMNVDKSKKRKSLLGPEAASPAAGGPSGQQSAGGSDRRDSSHRDSITATSATTKKGGQAEKHERRKLSDEEEILYGVTHHDRLTGGPSFRHDKVTRQITNKSAVQAAKITNMLTELEIPPRLIMPTAEVTHVYENLLASINTLIDTKKIADKLDAEIKLAEAQKAEREKKARRERGEPEPEPELQKEKTKEKSKTPAPKGEAEGVNGTGAASALDDTAETAEDADVSMQDINGATAADDEEDEEEEEEDDKDGEDEDAEEAEAEVEVEEDDEEDDAEHRPDADEDEDEDDGDAEGDADADAEEIDLDTDADAEEAEAEPEVKIEAGAGTRAGSTAAAAAAEKRRERNASVAPSTRSTGTGSLHKRSASVLSQVSDKSSKRLKK